MIEVVIDRSKQLVRDCRKAARDDADFSRFKSIPQIQKLVGKQVRHWTVPFWQYAAYHWPDCFSHRESFQKIDRFGGLLARQPVTNDLSISSNLAKDVATLATILRCFQSLGGLRIAEIGGGFGQLASIITQTQRPESYTIFDVPGVSDLQRRYTQEISVEKVDCVCQYPSSKIPFDLIIINHDYAPMSDPVRSQLSRCLLAKIHQGFITWGQSGYSSCNNDALPSKIFNCAGLSGWKHPQKPFQQAWGAVP